MKNNYATTGDEKMEWVERHLHLLRRSECHPVINNTLSRPMIPSFEPPPPLLASSFLNFVPQKSEKESRKNTQFSTKTPRLKGSPIKQSNNYLTIHHLFIYLFAVIFICPWQMNHQLVRTKTYSYSPYSQADLIVSQVWRRMYYTALNQLQEFCCRIMKENWK